MAGNADCLFGGHSRKFNGTADGPDRRISDFIWVATNIHTYIYALLLNTARCAQSSPSTAFSSNYRCFDEIKVDVCLIKVEQSSCKIFEELEEILTRILNLIRFSQCEGNIVLIFLY